MTQSLLCYCLDHLCSIDINFLMFLNNYHYIKSRSYIGITMSISLGLSMSVLFILLMHLVNGAQFLNIMPLSLSSACLAGASFLIFHYYTIILTFSLSIICCLYLRDRYLFNANLNLYIIFRY